MDDVFISTSIKGVIYPAVSGSYNRACINHFDIILQLRIKVTFTLIRKSLDLTNPILHEQLLKVMLTVKLESPLSLHGP